MTTQEQYKKVLEEARELMLKKNQDYGDSWRAMRLSSITDQILVKIKRVRQIEELGEQAIEDSIRNEYLDILNYAIFGIIKLDEDKILNSLYKACKEGSKAGKACKEEFTNKVSVTLKDKVTEIGLSNDPKIEVDSEKVVSKKHDFKIDEFNNEEDTALLVCSKCFENKKGSILGFWNPKYGSVKQAIEILNRQECKEEK